jgi:hypothetical protein
MMHAVTTCGVCKQSSFVASGIATPLTAGACERLLCDSLEIGDLESTAVQPLKPNIPTPTRRRVFVRDRFACAVPGCRSARHLDQHHVVWRSRGGTHAITNLVTLCGGHHDRVHDGRLVITGTAPDALVFQFHRPGEDEPHRVLTSAPVRFEAGSDEERSVPRGTEAEQVPSCFERPRGSVRRPS